MAKVVGRTYKYSPPNNAYITLVANLGIFRLPITLKIPKMSFLGALGVFLKLTALFEAVRTALWRP